MDNPTFKTSSKVSDLNDSQAKIKESASDLLQESKKLANDLYQDGVNKVSEKVNDVEDYVHEYSDKLIQKIQANPLSSVLVAAGVGLLLATFLRK